MAVEVVPTCKSSQHDFDLAKSEFSPRAQIVRAIGMGVVVLSTTIGSPDGSAVGLRMFNAQGILAALAHLQEHGLGLYAAKFRRHMQPKKSEQ